MQATLKRIPESKQMTSWAEFLQKLIIVVFIGNALCEEISTCGYAEEDKPYNFSVPVTKNLNGTYYISKGKRDVYECTRDQGCTPIPGETQNLHIKSNVQQSDVALHFNMSLKVVTRNDSGSIWAVRVKAEVTPGVPEKVEVLVNCSLEVYATVANLSCTETLKSNLLNFKCISKKADDRSLCILQISALNISKTVKFVTRNSSYECETSIPTTDINNRTFYEYSVFTYPNMTGNESDVSFGVNTIFSIGKPSIQLADCPTLIYTEGSEVNCTCKNEDTTDSTTIITWYRNGISLAVDTGNSTISLNTSKNITDQEIYCEATNAFGLKSDKKFYNLTFNSSCTNEALASPNNRDLSSSDLKLYIATTGTAFVLASLLALFIAVQCSYIQKWKDVKNINVSNLLQMEIDNSDIFMIGEESDSCYTIGTSVYRMLEPYVQHDLTSRMNSCETYMSDDSQACLIADSADASHKNTYPMRRCSRISIEDEPVNHYEYIT